MSKSTLWKCLLFVCGVGIGIGVVLVMSVNFWGWRDCQFRWVNPSRCVYRAEYDKPLRYAKMRDELASYIKQREEAGGADIVSLFAYDLADDLSINIDSEIPFNPASLLKVPIMVTYYKLAETDPALLQQTVTTPSTFNSPIQDEYPPENPIQPNRTYTIEELIYHMIVYSDNRAREVLLSRWPDLNSENNPIMQTHLALGFTKSADPNQPYVTVRQYAGMLRMLYNSVYLNQSMSTKALKLLSKTKFNDGLVKKLPSNVRVAHKFGVAHLENGNKQLQDCGIIYEPNAPYLVCVMTQGKNIDTDLETIQAISKTIYDNVTAVKNAVSLGKRFWLGI